MVSQKGVDVFAETTHNSEIDVLAYAGRSHVLAERQEALIAVDWTDFEKDDQMTCAAHLITNHGRTTPLVWKTVL